MKLQTLYMSFAAVLSGVAALPAGGLLTARDNQINAAKYEKTTSDTLWNLFWDQQQGYFSSEASSCQSASSRPAVLWDSAVAARAIVARGDKTSAQQVADALGKFQDQTGWFAATIGGSEYYTDDNSQVLWVLLEAYHVTGNKTLLSMAQPLFSRLSGQWDDQTGGVRWSVNGNYLASISATETALSGVMIYNATHDKNALSFAEKSLKWLFDNLEDSSDGFFYDGKDANSGNINRGKLMYTVGTAISSLAYLAKYTGNNDYHSKAVKLAQALTSQSGAFYGSSGYWNNALQFQYLAYRGLADLKTANPPGLLEYLTYNDISSEVLREGKMLTTYKMNSTTGYFYNNPLSFSHASYEKYNNAFSTGKSYTPDKKYFCQGSTSGANAPSLIETASGALILNAIQKFQ
ncbi:Piso0_003490 [Millerozyma farinosa CBS 7064]|uniref:Piso0_003490 protein n=1 Tax=Pichia sorbitophila (strain ATCC MYA-4447 / BCRC 22081 / CBS 7064 / NBRC 10061 / NRRL Y-12695) TaxID=559304 RepID=G8YJ79_PICSO|nr:Piso0_003490 [Millerozyma farinosa CBS 7064]CCE81139.1 Piso0_003490 [Millerozyma farinosa CBS 7064]